MTARIVDTKALASIATPASSQKKALARKAPASSVVVALPQPGGADLLRAKKQLMQTAQKA